jgi:hypothetical protein
MAKGVQFRRGTTSDHSAFTGSEGEITIDTDKDVAIVHDGTTVGGKELVGAVSNQRVINKDIEANTLIVSGVTTSSSFVGSGQNIDNLPIANYTIPYSNYSGLSKSSHSISGISTYNQVGIISTTQTSGSTYTPTFGWDIAISNDASVVYVSDIYYQNLEYSGAVYAFDKNSRDYYTQVGILTGIHAHHSLDKYGTSLVASKDGNRLIVGANSDEPLNGPFSQMDAGQVYYYERDGNNFNLVGIVTSSDPSLQGLFGHSIAANYDASTFAVGAYKDDDAQQSNANTGSVHVFDRDGGDITLVSALYGDIAVANDRFGWNVELSSDGNTLFVGSTYADFAVSGDALGVVYVFERVGNSYTQTQRFSSSNGLQDGNFGYVIKSSADGNILAVGSPGYSSSSGGRVHIFQRVNGTYIQLQELSTTNISGVTLDTQDRFGQHIALTPDGNILVVSAPFDEPEGSSDDGGLVYVFKKQGDHYLITCILRGDNVGASDYFGSSVAITDDGKKIFVGALSDELSGSSNYGMVYQFELSEETYLYASDSGNIGIGTAIPDEKLEVDGNLKTTGNIICDGNISLPVGLSSITSNRVYADKFYQSSISTGSPDTYFQIKETPSLATEFRYRGHHTITDSVSGYSFNVQEHNSDIITSGSSVYTPKPTHITLYFDTYFNADTNYVYFDLSPYLSESTNRSYYISYEISGIYSADGGPTGTYYNGAQGSNLFYYNASNTWVQVGHTQTLGKQTSTAFPCASRIILALYSNGSISVPSLRLRRANVDNATSLVSYTGKVTITTAFS